MAFCYRHPGRETAVSCSACGRPICTDCMVPTRVGMRCPACAGERTRVVRGPSLPARPLATYTLIAANVVAFFAEEGQFTLSGSSIRGPLIEEGVLARAPLAAHHQYWRLLSSAFLHENILHIFFNMYLLYLVGRLIEPALGHFRLLALYFTALLAGSCGALVATAAPSLGASGAIFGLMGAAAVELRARGLSVMGSGIGTLIVLNLVLSFALPNISYGAHVGGLIGGILAASLLREGDRLRLPWLGYLGCLALCAAAVAGAIAASHIQSAGLP